jgi:hypothetical protein
MNDNIRRFIIHRVKWLIVFMGIGSILVYLLPYPYDFISLSSFFVLMVYLRSRNEIEIWRYGWNKEFVWLILTAKARRSKQAAEVLLHELWKEHNEIACPDCGSKMKRVG